jgi:hypothetical protein
MEVPMSDPISIDHLFTANHCEVLNGMLYVNGGGFTEIFRPVSEDSTYINNFSVAFSFSIPEEETHKEHTFSVKLENKEGTVQLAETNGTFNISKPPNAPDDIDLHVVGSVQFNIIFPKPDTYQVVATLDNDVNIKRTWRFRVNDVVRGT